MADVLPFRRAAVDHDQIDLELRLKEIDRELRAVPEWEDWSESYERARLMRLSVERDGIAEALQGRRGVD